MINLNLFDFQQETVDRLLAYTEDITSKQKITNWLRKDNNSYRLY